VNLIRPRVFLVVALSVMIFTSTLAMLVSIHDAPSSFAADEGYVISSPGAPTVFSSSVDVGLVDFLPAASPEIFAFSSYDGVPFVIRGVDWKFLELTDRKFITMSRDQNGTKLARDQAVIGSGLRDRLGLVPPCALPVMGSYQSKFEVVDVIGWFESSSSLDDELIVNLDMARSLSGMSSDKVSIVRLTSVSSEVRDLLMPTGPRFAIYDFASSRSRVVVGEDFELEVSLKNWGTKRGSVNLSIFDDQAGEVAIFRENIALDAGDEIRFSHPYSFDQIGIRDFSVSIDGKDPQRLTLRVEFASRYLVVWGPSAVALGSTFEVTVTDYAQYPVAGARVEFLNQTVYTNAAGTAVLNASELGTRQMIAYLQGYEAGGASFVVYDGSTYPNEFKPVIALLEVVPNDFKETEAAQVCLMVENDGQQAGVFVGTIILDGSARIAEVSIPLEPGESKVVFYPLGRVSPGHHIVKIGVSGGSFDVYPWYAGESDMIMMAVRYGGTLKISFAKAIPIVQAAKLSQGDVEVALISIGGISGTLAALSMISIFSKEIHEGRDKLGILRTIGASRSVIRRMVVRQSLAFSFPAALTGIALGLGVSGILLRSKWLMIFGHSLRYDVGASVAPWILIGTLVICLASSLASAEVAARASPISSIRKIEDASPERKTVDEVLGVE